MKSKEKDTLRSETQDEPKSKEQVLTFSHQLRREIETACRQLDNREGQNNLTINKEVAEWLSSNMVTRRQETVEGNIPDTKIEEWE